MDRDKLYEHFGPMLLEATARVILDEINVLRIEAGLSERTIDQVITALKNKYDSLDDYDWMG